MTNAPVHICMREVHMNCSVIHLLCKPLVKCMKCGWHAVIFLEMTVYAIPDKHIFISLPSITPYIIWSFFFFLRQFRQTWQPDSLPFLYHCTDNCTGLIYDKVSSQKVNLWRSVNRIQGILFYCPILNDRRTLLHLKSRMLLESGISWPSGFPITLL